MSVLNASFFRTYVVFLSPYIRATEQCVYMASINVADTPYANLPQVHITLTIKLLELNSVRSHLRQSHLKGITKDS